MSIFKRRRARRTRKRPIVRMRRFMRLQIHRPDETLLAHIANERLEIQMMQVHMVSQLVFRDELLIAVRARVGLIQGVRNEVAFQGATGVKTRTALRTEEISLIGVTVDVEFQRVAIRKRFAANGAFVVLNAGVGVYV